MYTSLVKAMLKGFIHPQKVVKESLLRCNDEFFTSINYLADLACLSIIIVCNLTAG